ncbi:hypothetical protein CC85DRAFT_314616 [Cutaneotrichosporon oleaginosum]|uniref:Amino acid transporter transmembrane domain-containing protein n=1 Tax=Cutaneotrichosporon oleaginosum TaxID=879819 RepID=A0A0J0XZE8_9TREE|nr:uncharacterized protein CC85DRAFT_314616 [Cutaneotrichosporon oleaginosum]KLT46411.1 hypothetical protein CC85DRAFT_314616 [Cutaneotrichosporon oleaginosum]TXT15219.1 hypothetical protein COLE_01412 [Cutaneotrichosporon oleaginosum]
MPKRHQDIEDIDEKPTVTPPDAEHMSKEETVTAVLERVDYISKVTEDGEAKFHKLTWQQLVVVLIVCAVALGTLSMPLVFMMLGMIGGTILTVGMGLIAIYTSFLLGTVKLKYPQVRHYSDVGRLLLPGRAGHILTKVLQFIFVFFVMLGVAAHFLTGKQAFSTIVGDKSICQLAWSAVTLVLLFICSLPPSFSEMAVLGYVDFVSIMGAVLITLIATGIDARKKGWDTGWSAYPMPGLTFGLAMIAASNVLFAYAFSIAQFTFMEEMAEPSDFPKSIAILGAVMILIYTLTGALGYAFIGPGVKGPALLSAGPTISRVAFGVALPVIFISGAILVTTIGRFIMDHMFRNSIVRYVNTARGWMTWIGIVFTTILVSWIVAEAIPVFSSLLSITASLFNSGFTLYLPAIMWFTLLREGGCFSSGKNIALTILNAFIIICGLIIFGVGTWASVDDIVSTYRKTGIGRPFSCK